ncbi:hypothetical protein GC174_13560 [bacterium]|nr:hypothetical protein [bacterium]
MNKPNTSLALSALIALSQAGWQSASATPADGAIWQKLSDTAGGKSIKKVATKKAVSSKKVATKQTSGAAAPQKAIKIATNDVSIDESHSMLFLPGRKDVGALGAGPAPAAALSIHPSLPASMDAAPVAINPAISSPSAEATSEIPIDEEIKSKAQTAHEAQSARSEDFIAQLAADNLIAQSSSSEITASPIPPVVTGTVDLEEYKPTNVIDVKVSRSRTFKLRNKVVRTSISDPGIVEPVVVSENQLVLLGKSPGKATLVIWDDAGNNTAIDVKVSRDYNQLQATLREIDPRIIVKTYSVGGSDRVILYGDVDHPESVVRAFAAANVYMDDRGMSIQVANNRLINARIGEMGAQGGGGQAGGQTGQLAQLSSVDRYTFFPNLNNNVSLAQGIVSDGGRVTSLIKVRKVPLIALHVTFMEMNTLAARQLGVSLGFNFSGPGFGFGIGGSTANAAANGSYLVSIPGANQRLPGFSNSPQGFPVDANIQGISTNYSNASVSFVNPAQATQVLGIGLPIFPQAAPILPSQILFGAPGGAAFQTAGLGNLLTAVSNFATGSPYKFSVNPSVQGIIAHNRARVLSEPTLVCISGERASFLAGGEIPILQAIATAGQNQFSVTFEPFGMRINMIPVLMENGSINLEVSPEERVISNAFAFNFPGSNTNIPGFTTRKVQTIVEMKPGQELFISGMVTTNNGRELNKYPIFGEIPVIGALYRSKSFNKNESELVIAIRPEVILPGTPGQLKLPEEIGRVEGPRDMNMFQVEPTVVDERHYTSGRAERHQKTSPTLPEGAPIPDFR